MITVTTEATTEPITVTQAKEWLGIDTDVTTHDTELTACIAGARKKVEQLSGRSLVARTLKLTLDDYINPYLDLPYPSITSIVSVKTYDTEGTATTYVDGTDYHLVSDRLYFQGNGYPLEVVYVTAANNEEFYKLAIKKQLAYDYKNSDKDNGFDADVKQMISTVTLNLGY